jgi:hypothetical protein
MEIQCGIKDKAEVKLHEVISIGEAGVVVKMFPDPLRK